MPSHGEARKMRRGHSRPGYHPSVAWRWSLESGLRSKDSRVVRRRVVGKVPIEATRWRPILPHVRCSTGSVRKRAAMQRALRLPNSCGYRDGPTPQEILAQQEHIG